MYNRYLRNDDGIYTRVPMQDPPRDEPPRQPPHGNAPPSPPPEPPPCGESPGQEASQFFSRLLDKLPLKGVDKADLLLLLILFFLFEEKADDELLVALGLLLMTVRRLSGAERHLRQGRWPDGPFPLSPSTLSGRTLGILGRQEPQRTPPPRLSPLSCPCTSCLREAKSTAAAVLFVLLFLVVEAAVAVALKLGICDLLAELPAHTDVVLGLLEAARTLQIAL